MESSDKIVFKVMVTFPTLLEQRIESYNKLHVTDFKIVETINDEVPFCKIQVTALNESHIFNLGYGLAVLQYSLKEKGELDW